MKTAFIHANVLDVLNRTVLFDHTVLTEDGMITAVTSSADTAGYEIVDLEGKYLTPGLFNCHIHVTSTCEGDMAKQSSAPVDRILTALKNMEAFIRTGVTFVRDVGTPDGIALDLRQAVKDGRIKMAPDMQACGTAICMTGGTGRKIIATEVDGEVECRREARRLVRQGVDVVKLMATGGTLTHGTKPGCPELTEEEMRAAVEAAHAEGLQVISHAESNEGVRNAIRAGVDCIEHGDDMDEETVRLMVEHGTWLDGTVSALYCILRGKDKGLPEEFYQKAIDAEGQVYRSFNMAFHAGVPCAAGSDCGSSFCYHDESAIELVIMVEKCGITAMDAMVVGTINSARLCGVEESLGSVTVGKKAHFAVFAENPAENIRAAMDCCMTVKNGEILWQK